MEFTLQKNTKISVLSWFLKINRNQDKAVLIHGANVEVSNQYFVEGGWDNAFENMDFDKSIFFLGTGGKIINDNLLLCAPSHPLERLYSIQEKDTLYFSNSLPFILKMTHSETDKSFYKYEEYFLSIIKGIDKYKKTLPLAHHKQLHLYYCRDLCIDKDLTIKEYPKKGPEPFKNFADYDNQLNTYIEKLKKNLTSSKRKVQYPFITTVSSGYDSSTCAALAKKYGCTTAVTVNRPGKYLKDSGEEIAKTLGYKNILLGDGDHYLHNKALLEAEYLSSGDLGQGLTLSTFNKDFKGKAVFIGTRGDRIWRKKATLTNNKFRFIKSHSNESAHIESRLKLGYILIPIALFGGNQWKSIKAISNSKEMAPYSIGGDYDRPIPRKILEDMGIPREMFGMKKTGIGFMYSYDNKSRLKKRMAALSFQHFITHYKPKNTPKRFVHFLRFLAYNKKVHMNFVMHKFKIPIKLKGRRSIISNPYIPIDLFNWSTEVMKERY